ncbi:unnamed protein product [Ostreobium quekettii]|uniref:Sister chromatid cohesion protein n=1 Tax=Ostreobium quekettii TaxID=121088 RepID=A0A8S1JEA4_9CHLO|nr:unnamed protein product [Ostreobium quekettii]
MAPLSSIPAAIASVLGIADASYVRLARPPGGDFPGRCSELVSAVLREAPDVFSGRRGAGLAGRGARAERRKIKDGQPRKRRRSAAYRQPVKPAGVGAKAAAAALGGAIRKFLEEGGGEGSEAGRRLGRGGAGAGARPSQLLEEVVRAKAAGAVATVPPAQWLGLFRVLVPRMRDGIGGLSGDSDGDNSVACGGVVDALDAATVCLHILTSPGMALEVQQEEVIDLAVELAKHHLQNSVYVFFCPAHREMHCGSPAPGPSGREQEQKSDSRNGSSKKRKQRRGSECGSEWTDAAEAWINATKASSPRNGKQKGHKAPTFAMCVLSKLEVMVQLLCDFLDVVQIEASVLLSCIRVMLLSLSMRNVTLLQVKIVRLVAAAFKLYPSLRQNILEEFVAVLLKTDFMDKSMPCEFLADSNGSRYIRVTTALLMGITQVSVVLPSMEADSKEQFNCFGPAVWWADSFWKSVFDRLPNARAQRLDGVTDVKGFVEAILSDLFLVCDLPEWPAAAHLLHRFILMLGGDSGLKHTDSTVRQLCVEFLGIVTAKLCEGSLAARESRGWIQQVVKLQRECLGSAGDLDAVDALQRAVVEHLCIQTKVSEEAARSARHFLVCRMYADHLQQLRANGEEVEKEEMQRLLVQYRGFCELPRVVNGSMPDSLAAEQLDLTHDQGLRVTRAIVHMGVLGQGKTALLKWLSESCDRSRQESNYALVRARAVKSLGMVVEADMGILTLPEVKMGVNAALQDDSTMVREAAVDLLGRYIGTSQDLALAYFDLLCSASKDSGTSVRKRALKILWECCVQPQGFPRATEACVHILQRAGDPEEAVQSMVTKVFGTLWFGNGCSARSSAGVSSDVSLEARAQQVADVSLAVYNSSGPRIHLPLTQQHPLIVVLNGALGSDEDSFEWNMASNIASALLEATLQAQDGNGTGQLGECTLAYLLALHALCCSASTLLVSDSDPQRFARCLQPYLQALPKQAGPSGEDGRRGAEVLVCILSIIGAVVERLQHIDSELVNELTCDLRTIIFKHAWSPVVSAACRCFAILAKTDAKVAEVMRQATHRQHSLVREIFQAVNGGEASGKKYEYYCTVLLRQLFILGHLCRYGAGSMDTHPAEGTDLLKECLDTTVLVFGSSRELVVKESALRAMGMMFICRADLMISNKDVDSLTRLVLSAGADELKTQALANLSDLLRADEERLMEAQKQSKDEQDDAAAMGQISARAQALPAQNGQGEGAGVTSGILQRLWKPVLELATSVPAQRFSHRNGNDDPGSASSCTVRRSALDLMEAALRAGLVAPWTAVAHLIALATDPNLELASRAVRLLKQEADKFAQLFASETARGIVEAYKFSRKLQERYPCMNASGTSGNRRVVQGLAALYSEVIRPGRDLRRKFLEGLLKPFDEGSDLDSGKVGGCDLRLLSFCANVASQLTFIRGDELCSLVHGANGIISRRGDVVLSTLRASLFGDVTESAKHRGLSLSQGSTRSLGLPDNPFGSRSALVQAACKASVALSILLLLKQFIKSAYSVSDERIAQFTPIGERRRQEERTNVTRSKKARLRLDGVDLDAHMDPDRMRKHYSAFKRLMKDDAVDYASEHAAGSTKAGLDGDAMETETADANGFIGDTQTPVAAKGCVNAAKTAESRALAGKKRPRLVVEECRKRPKGGKDKKGVARNMNGKRELNGGNVKRRRIG